MKTASSSRYGLAAAGFAACLLLAACGGGSGGGGTALPIPSGQTPPAGDTPQPPGGEPSGTPALKCAP